jgi:hypothetical protein
VAVVFGLPPRLLIEEIIEKTNVRFCSLFITVPVSTGGNHAMVR